MKKSPFAVLENRDTLSHAYLCYGGFNECEESFNQSLNVSGVRLRSPGHYIFENETFGVDDARNLIAWYHNGTTSNDDAYTIAVIASKVIKKDAQQMLLKILEEAKHPYLFFIFAESGVEIIDTVLSRVQKIHTNEVVNTRITNFVNLKKADQIKMVADEIKGLESSEIRGYTEELVRGLIVYFNQESNPKQIEKITNLLKVQNALVESRIAPKFILDYIITVL